MEMEEVKKDSLSDQAQPSGVKPRIVILILLVFGIVIILGIFSYGVLSTKNGFGLGIFDKGSGEETQGGSTVPTSNKTEPTSVSVTSPTPRPKGPGTYACSPSGVCNEYDDPKKEDYGCPVTFADRFCLDSCNDLGERCAK